MAHFLHTHFHKDHYSLLASQTKIICDQEGTIRDIFPLIAYRLLISMILYVARCSRSVVPAWCQHHVIWCNLGDVVIGDII